MGKKKKGAKSTKGKGGKKGKKVKQGDKKKKNDDEELDPTKYTENRKKFIAKQRQEGKNPYPHKFHRDCTIPLFRE